MINRLVSPVWAVLEYFWYPILFFASTPYFLHALGTEKYGQWMLLMAAIGFGSLLSGGTGAATVKHVSSGRGRASSSEVEQTVRASLAIALLAGGLVSLLILGTFWFAGDPLFEKMGHRSVIQLTGVVAALLAWIEQIDNVFASALKGAEQFGRAARIEMASRTVQVVAAMLAVAVGQGRLEPLYATLVAIAIARLLVKAWSVRRFLALSSLRPSFTGAGEMLDFAKWGWVQGVGSLLFGVADRLVIGSFLGATSLAFYSVASQLAQQVHGISAAALSVVFPKISRKRESNQTFSLWRTTKWAMAASLLVSSAGALILLVFGRQILTLWLGSAYAEASAEILWYLTIAYWLLALNVAPHFILLGLGRMRFIAVSNIMAGVVLIIGMYFLVPSFGLIGVGLARMLYAGIALAVLFPLAGHLRSARRTHTSLQTKS